MTNNIIKINILIYHHKLIQKNINLKYQINCDCEELNIPIISIYKIIIYINILIYIINENFTF